MKSIKQIADELGISKQRVYRYIKTNHITEAHQDRDTRYYDEAAVTMVKSHFRENNDAHQSTSEVHHEANDNTLVDTLVSMLKHELDAKNKQIAELTSALNIAQQTAAHAQALHAGTMKHLTSSDDKKSNIFSRMFGRRKDDVAE